MIMIYNFLLYEGGDDFNDQVGCTLVALFVQFSRVADYDKVKLYYIVIITWRKHPIKRVLFLSVLAEINPGSPELSDFTIYRFMIE